MSLTHLTSDLRKVPQERIEIARLIMELLQAQNQVTHLPNCDEIIKKFQIGHDIMKRHLLDYYPAKKSVLEAKRKHLAVHKLQQHVQFLRKQFVEQQRNWTDLIAIYALKAAG